MSLALKGEEAKQTLRSHVVKGEKTNLSLRRENMSRALKGGKTSLSLRRDNMGPALNGGKMNRMFRKNRNWKDTLFSERQSLSKLIHELIS